MRESEIESIAQLPLFESLTPEYRDQLLRNSLIQRVPTGVTLFEQGERPDFLHILLEGTVELRAQDPARHEAVVEIVQPVENFILAAVVTDAPYLMTARTSARSRLLLIPAEQLRNDLRTEPGLALMVIGSLARHYRGLIRQIKSLKLRTSTERIGCFLLALAAEQKASGTVVLPYSKRLLAQRMGMTPENLSRAFAQLRERGVRLEGSRVIIDDMELLASHCHPDALIDDVEMGLTVPGITDTGATFRNTADPGQPGDED